MMYKPAFNTVLVEIDSETDKWGKGNDESMLGQAYREGTIVEVSKAYIPVGASDRMSRERLENLTEYLPTLIGKRIMWNEGVEAGTVFEHDGKMYGFIYWNDIRGVA